MTQETTTREIVGVFADKDHFEAAVNELLAQGFTHGQLSVLSSHESLELAQQKSDTLSDTLAPMINEARFEVPLVASLLIALSSGPAAAAVAALVAAGVGGMALKDFIEKITSAPDPGDFARALEAGSIILWVAVETPEEEQKARRIMARNEGRDIHLHEEPHQP